MRLVKEDNLYVFLCDYTERFAAKGAGFSWDKNKRRWKTENPRIALKLAAYADDELRAELLPEAEGLPDPDKATLTFDGTTWKYYSPYEFNRYAKDAGMRVSKVPVWHWWTEDIAIAFRCYQAAAAGAPDVFICDAEAQDILRKEQAKRAAAIVASRASDADVDIPVPEGVALLPYQRAGVAYARTRDAVLFGDEVRLGKTPQSIAWCNCDPSIKSVLIIVPATIKLNWLREWKRWSTLGLTVGVAWGLDSWPDTEVVITNAEILYRQKDKRVEPVLLKSGKPKMKKTKAGMVPVTQKVYPCRPEILARKWDVVIVDEVHKFKEEKTARTQCLMQLSPRKRGILSGTISPNGRPIEMWPTLHWLIPSVFGKQYTRWAFAMRFAAATRGPFGWDVSGASNLQEFQELLRRNCMVRRLQSQVWTEMPKKRRMLIEFPCPDDRFINEQDRLWKRYTEISDDVKACVEMAEVTEEREDYKDNVLALKSDRLACFEEMSRIRHEDAVKRIPFIIEHLSELVEQENKVLCAAWHNDVVEAYAKHFGAQAVVIYGKTPPNQRVAMQDRFNNDPNIKLCIVSIPVCEGLDLSAASLLVMSEWSWVPKDIQQAEGRIENAFKKDSSLIQYCVFQGSLDARQAQTLIYKEDIAHAALDKEFDIPEFVDVSPSGIEIELPEKLEASGPVSSWAPSQLLGNLIGDQENPNKNAGPYAGSAPSQLLELSPADCRDILIAVRTLAGVCDGAFAKDGAGFNGIDARFGHSLACRDELTPRAASVALKMLRKYNASQLGGMLDRFYD